MISASVLALASDKAANGEDGMKKTVAYIREMEVCALGYYSLFSF